MLTSKKIKRNPRRRTGMTQKSMLVLSYGPLVKSNSFQPRWMYLEMKYSDQFLITLLGGNVLDQNYRSNSLFDPDRTGTGHQPRGFDQITPLYNKYRVDSLRWRISFAAAATAYNVCVALVNGVQNYTTLTDIVESTNSPVRTQSAGAAGIICADRRSIHIVQGRSQLSYHADDITGAVVNTNPVEVTDLHIFIQNPAAATVALDMVVELTYCTIFYDLIIPSAS